MGGKYVNKIKSEYGSKTPREWLIWWLWNRQNQYENNENGDTEYIPIDREPEDPTWTNWGLSLGDSFLLNNLKQQIQGIQNAKELVTDKSGKYFKNYKDNPEAYKDFYTSYGSATQRSKLGNWQEALANKLNFMNGKERVAVATFSPEGTEIIYNTSYFPNTGSFLSTAVHELTHAAGMRSPQIKIIGDSIQNGRKKDVEYDSYYDNPTEIYARLMEFRMENDLNPSTKIDKKFLNSKRSQSLLKRYNLHRYTDDYLLFLLNEVAQNEQPEIQIYEQPEILIYEQPELQEDIQYAKEGLKLRIKKLLAE